MNVGTIRIGVGMSLGGLSKGLMSARAQLSGFGASVKSQAASLVRFGAVAGVAGAAAGTLALGVKSFSDSAAIGSQAIDLAKVANLSGEEIEAMKDSIVDLGAGMKGVSTQSLFEIATAGARMGVPKEQLRGYAEAIGMLSLAIDDLDPGEIAGSIGILTNTFELDAVQGALSLGSAIDGLADSMATSNGQIIEIMKRSQQAGKGLGLTADQLAAYSATLSATGMMSEKAGGALNRFFSTIIDGKKHAQIESILGLGNGEFTKMVEQDANGATMALLGALNSMTSADQKMKAIESLGIGGETRFATLALADAHDTLGVAVGTASEKFQSQSQVFDAYDANSKKFSAQMEQIKNQILKVTVSIGDHLVPIASKGVEIISEWLTSNSEAFQAWASNALDAGGFVAKAISFVGGSIGTLIDVVNFLRGVWHGLQGLLIVPFAGLAKVIGLCLIGVQKLIKFTTGQELALGGESLNEWANGMQMAVDEFGDKSAAAFNSEAGDKIREAFGGISSKFSEVGQKLEEQRQEVENKPTTVVPENNLNEPVANAVQEATNVVSGSSLAGTLSHGSTEARSLLLNHRGGRSEDQVKIAQEQLKVQRETRDAIKRVARPVPMKVATI